jgi:hypothetical protein
MTADGWSADTRTSYDTVAAAYADQLRGALAGHPYLRAALALFADTVHATGGGRLKTERYGGHPMKVHVHRRPVGRVSTWLRDAGFTVEAQTLLGPDASVPGAILFARRDP